jgi:hypothetical protein
MKPTIKTTEELSITDYTKIAGTKWLLVQDEIEFLNTQLKRIIELEKGIKEETDIDLYGGEVISAIIKKDIEQRIKQLSQESNDSSDFSNEKEGKDE